MPKTAKILHAGMSFSELPIQARLRLEYAGRWVAWSEDRTEVVAVGDDPETVHEVVRKAGNVNVVYEWVPPVPVRLLDPRA